MLVQMVLTGKVKDVSQAAADLLFKAKAAVPAYETRQVTPVEISERTGKPKRQYRRRDMRAEG